MRAWSCLILLSTLVLILFLYVDNAEAAPGKRTRPRYRPRYPTTLGRLTTPRYKTTPRYQSGVSYGGGSTYKKKGSKLKTLKKAAIIGAVAYGTYKLGKMKAGFGGWKYGRSHGIDFDKWDSWRQIDGFMCRDSNDCNWIDSQLYCQDYKLDFSPSVSFDPLLNSTSFCILCSQRYHSSASGTFRTLYQSYCPRAVLLVVLWAAS